MKHLNLSKVILLVVAVLLLIVAVVATQQLVAANAERPMPTPAPKIAAPDVSISWQQAQQYESSIEGYGSASPHYEISLTAQVSGQIDKLSTQFETGQHIKQNDWLAKLENSDYRAALAEAKQTLAEANVSLLEEQRQGQQAMMEWKTSGLAGEPDSDLVLRKPQLIAAKASLKKAQTDVAKANKDLSYTTIKAPFDAVVVDRHIAPGSYVQQGSNIATLYSADRVEIRVSLSTRDWHNLPAKDVLTTEQWPVTINSVENDLQWQGYIIRTEQHLNSETRQHTLVVAVDKPFNLTPALLPGTFVKVTITGEPVDKLWRLPSSALSQRGEIWYVDDKQTLAKFSASPLFSQDDQVFIKVPDDLSDKKVAVLNHPLNSYLTGMKVNPQELADE